MRWHCTILLLFLAATTLANMPSKKTPARTELRSPDGRLRMQLFTAPGGQLMYTLLTGKANSLIGPSPLGIQVNNIVYGTQVSGIGLRRSQTIDEQYTTRGKHAVARNYCRYYTLTIEQGHSSFILEVKLFNDGAAWRYRIDEGGEHHVHKELTTWQLPAGSRVWYFERNNDWKLKSYAGLWESTVVDSLPLISKQGPVQGKPLVVHVPGSRYLVITEAALYNYSGLRLKAIGNRMVQANFTEEEKGFTVKGPLTTPWRVLICASGLDALVNTDIIQNLNPGPDPAYFPDTSYIRPGRAVWSWITRNELYLRPSEEKKFIDAAARLHFEYSLIDDGWETKWPAKWEQLKELCDHAAKQKVKIWVWKHSAQLRDSLVMEKFLDSVQQAGAAGIKVDFMNSEAKPLVDFEISLLKACARRKLMVDFHGCQAPTGESRSYPNEMTREGIRGMELNIMNEPIPAYHNAALPFTRLLCGHGDYTPGFFSKPGPTTWAHQLALLYLFDSPFQCMAENPAFIDEHDRQKIMEPLLQTLPVVWDETIVLPGSEIGRLAAFARRKGNTWYVAVINGTSLPVQWNFQATFLEAKQRYHATLIADNPGNEQQPLSGIEMSITQKFSTQFLLHANGGAVIKIEKTL